jgi:hypothetical protein
MKDNKITDTKAVATTAPLATVSDAPKAGSFKRKAAVTLALRKLTLDTSHFLMIDGVIHIKAVGEGETRENWPVMAATDLTTGEQSEVLVDKVLQGTLQEKYPDDGYVGKAFEIIKSKRTGKKYHDYNVWEVEVV